MAMNNPYAAYQNAAKNYENTKKKENIQSDEVKLDIGASYEAPPKTYSGKVVNMPKNLANRMARQDSEVSGSEPVNKDAADVENFVPANGVPKFEQETQNQSNPYLENTVMTASPQELTLMLYDGAIKFMNQAVLFIQAKKFAKAHEVSIKAQDIFMELLITLNTDYEIGESLHHLYVFILDSLKQANLKKDKDTYREMIGLTRELRDTWSEAMKSMNVKK